uniref:Uncharacterized protein n=1 Tax=Meloidogyne enterolobii TaxID=390850 RepID=A0A6V7TNI2_MELEN|nr:unnamed protein product [Meloidogyne enterolobii]
MAFVSSVFRCIVLLLMLLGFGVHCDEVGLGKHVLDDGKIVELKDLTKIAKDDTDLERYRKLPGACDVTMDDGNIILSYTKNSKTTESGCSVDLVTKNKGQVLLEFVISNPVSLGGLAECIPKGKNQIANLILFSFSMKRDEFEKLKEGPSLGDNSDCSDEKACEGRCWNSTAFYSVGWTASETNNKVDYNAILLPVLDTRGDGRDIEFDGMDKASSKIMFRQNQFRFLGAKSESFLTFSPNCYKMEKLGKVEEWKIEDENYKNDQNFNHLFTFNIMPPKPIQALLCKNNLTKPGCEKDSHMQKCDKIFIKFDKEYFRMLVPDASFGQTTTTTTEEEETSDYDEEETEGNNSKTTVVASGLGTIAIVLITFGILLCVTIVIGILLWFFVCRGKNKKENEPNEEEYPPPPTTTTTTTKENSTIGGKKDSSTVVGTQYDEDLNEVGTVMGTQIGPGDVSKLDVDGFSAKAGKVPDTLRSTNTVKDDPNVVNSRTGVAVPESIYG